ncbi:MAG: ABC-2 type transport system permease protein, partial [Flavobacteriales bacterium]
MSWKQLINREFYAIFTNIPLLVTVFGGVIIYSYLYPLPYLNQIPKEQSIAVINLD